MSPRAALEMMIARLGNTARRAKSVAGVVAASEAVERVSVVTPLAAVVSVVREMMGALRGTVISAAAAAVHPAIQRTTRGVSLGSAAQRGGVSPDALMILKSSKEMTGARGRQRSSGAMHAGHSARCSVEEMKTGAALSFRREIVLSSA